MQSIINKFRFIQNKIRNLIKTGYISRVSSDDKDVQIAQVTYLGLTKDTAIITPYGVFSNAPLKSKVLLCNVLAQEENAAGIAYAQQNRFKNLKEGEVVLGNILTQSYVKLDSEGNIVINSPDKKITIEAVQDVVIKSTAEIKLEAPAVEIVNGNITITGGAGTMTVNGDLNMDVNGDANIDATQVNLGTSGNQIARVGDAVAVDTGTGIGTITSGGTNTSI